MKSIIAILAASTGVLSAASPLDAYKITWDTPSRDSIDSIPLSGRLGAGADVWVQDGLIWLYLAHSGAFDEQGRLRKLGCVRLTPDQHQGVPSVFSALKHSIAGPLPGVGDGDAPIHVYF